MRDNANNTAMLFDDLGDITQCGSLIKKRLKMTLKRWNKNQVFIQHGSDKGELTTWAEKKVYTPFSKTFKFRHGMVLPDGSPWGGKEELAITLNFTSHVQSRMDSRCVNEEEVQNVILTNLRGMANAWSEGDYHTYRSQFYHFFEGSKDINDGFVVRNVRVPIAPSTISPYYEEEIGGTQVKILKGDTSYSLITVINQGVARVRKLPIEVKEDKCVNLLEDNRYTVISKYASESDTSVLAVGSNWIGGVLPSRTQQMLISIDLMGTEGEIQSYTGITPENRRDRKYLSSFREAIREWVGVNLIDEASKSSLTKYKSNMEDFLETGFEVTDAHGVKYEIKPSLRMKRYLIEVPFKGDVVKTINLPVHGRENAIQTFLRVDSVRASARLEMEFRKIKREKEIKDCLETVKDRYRVIDPQGKEMRLASLRKKARFFGLLSTPISDFEMRRFMKQIGWMFRKGQLDVVHYVDRTNTCHIIKISAKGVNVEVKGFFVNQEEAGSNYKNLKVVVDDIPKKVSDPKEALEVIFEVFSDLGLRK